MNNMIICKKERLLLLLSMMIMVSLALTSCTDDLDNTGGGGESGDKDKKYVERLAPVVDPKNSPQGTVMLRFYDDMPNVAYVNVSRFHEMMYPGTTIQVQSLGSGKFSLTSPCGTAMVDTENNLFMSSDYEAFTNMMGMVQPGMPNVSYDALPIIRWKSLEKTPQQVHMALDYGKFDIDLRADDA